MALDRAIILQYPLLVKTVEPSTGLANVTISELQYDNFIPATSDELHLVEALRAGDEAAFASLLDQYHASLVRLACIYVSSRAVAEEVAQETWLGVLQGLDRFEGRSSLKTWIFRILTNRAKTRGQREARRTLGKLTEETLPPQTREELLQVFKNWKNK